MKKKTKKTYRVCCEVNMDASHDATVMVVATKPKLACDKAVKELLRQGFFYAWPRSCEEVEDGPNK